jgi:hypothetical protein
MKGWTTAQNRAPIFATGDGTVSQANNRLLVMEIMWLLGMVMDTKHCTRKYNRKAGQRVAEET